MRVAVGEGQCPHPLGIERREDLGDAAAAVVADQVDLIDLQRIEHLLQHRRVSRHGDILARRDLGVAMRQKIDGHAAANVGEPGQLVPPEMLVQHHAVDEERDRTGAGGGVADATGRRLDMVRGWLAAHGSALRVVAASLNGAASCLRPVMART